MLKAGETFSVRYREYLILYIEDFNANIDFGEGNCKYCVVNLTSGSMDGFHTSIEDIENTYFK